MMLLNSYKYSLGSCASIDEETSKICYRYSYSILGNAAIKYSFSSLSLGISVSSISWYY